MTARKDISWDNGHDNTIIDNQEDGLFLRDSSENTILDNIINNNSHYGIYLKNSSNNLLSGNELKKWQSRMYKGRGWRREYI